MSQSSRDDKRREDAPTMIYVWYAEDGSGRIRKWDTKPFPEGIAYAISRESTCAACKGSGTMKGMTQGHGPDDYEIDIECSKCGGTGAITSPSSTAPSFPQMHLHQIERDRLVLKLLDEVDAMRRGSGTSYPEGQDPVAELRHLTPKSAQLDGAERAARKALAAVEATPSATASAEPRYPLIAIPTEELTAEWAKELWNRCCFSQEPPSQADFKTVFRSAVKMYAEWCALRSPNDIQGQGNG